MYDSNDFLEVIKRTAINAIKTTQPSNFYMGKVISTSPLKISIEQKLTLGATQLVLTRNVTDYKTNISVDWETESKSGGSGDSSFANHSHSVSGTKEVTIHNGLKIGDIVVLLKEQGGQRYLIFDKVVNQ